MKQDLPEELGLTEKQISGWFGHRRLKDKRLLKDEAIVSSLEWTISKGKGRVYVHCTAGLGRAPGVTIAYLI
ncbi:hypothetical protein AHAS_Ahas11G0226000 [Arachis hypogaea]